MTKPASPEAFPTSRKRLLPPGTVVDGRYAVVRKLGAGATGVVYEAEQIATGQHVALKLIQPAPTDPEEVETTTKRFRREVQLIGQLSHPNIVRLLDVGQGQGGQLYMVLEFVQGETLAQYIKNNPELSPETSKRLMLQVLDALSAAHDLRIVHRDLKPHNIMVTSTGARPNAKVLDFGIAALLQDARDPGYWTLTTEGTVVGTPAYMSPDQLRGHLSNRIDIYAWGLIFIECLTGQRAIMGDTAAHAMFLQLSDTAVPIPARLRNHPVGAILARATAKNPDERYTSTREVITALEECHLGDIDVAKLRNEGLATESATALPSSMTPVDSSVQPTAGLRRCPHCSAEVPGGFKFCGACGRSIDAESSGTQPTAVTHGERRQLTIVWCGLANASELHAALEPDALHDLLTTYHSHCGEVVAAHQGKIVVYPGDGVLAYFGHPVAREDDARRAVAAGLALIDAVKSIPGPEGPLAAQVAVHTGRVVASGAADQLGLVGPVVTTAERLKRFAEPGQLLASEATLKLVEGWFSLGASRDLAVEGARPAMTAAIVTGRTAAKDRLDATESNLSPLVGRKQELELLAARWRSVTAGSGQVALITGEAGIGKSRVVRAFRDQLGNSGRWLDAKCTPETENTAFAPVVEVLRELIGLAREDDARGEVSAAHGELAKLVESLQLGPFAGPIIAKVTGIAPPHAPPPPLSPPRMRREMLETLAHVFFGLADQRPLVLAVEDLHWADPSTAELLGLLVEGAQSSKLMLMLTARPSFQPGWPSTSHLTQLHIGPLQPAEIEELVQRILGVSATRPLAEDIASRTDGVPLFVEELARAVKDAQRAARKDDDDAPPQSTTHPVPTTLHDSLMARLDRTGDARRIAQRASVIGRHFDHGLLESISAGEELEPALDKLLAEGLLFRRGRAPNARYTFKHALLRDAAYQSLLKRTRREVHRQIGEVLSERPGTPPELVAHHFSEAAELPRAVMYWQVAGQQALQSAAFAEAVRHTQRGLEICAQLPDSPEKIGAELGLRVTLGVPMMLMRGFAAPEVQAVYGRAYDLARQAGQVPQMFPALWGLWMYYHVSGAYPRAHTMADQLRELAQSVGDPGMMVGALQALGATTFLRGHFQTSIEHFQGCLAIYDEQAHWHLAFLFGQDAAVFCQSHLSWIWSMYGEHDRARACIADALARCARLGQPSSLGFAMHFDAVLHCLLGKRDAATQVAAELIKLSGEQGMPHWAALAQVDRGWALTDSGKPQQGAEDIRAGTAALQATGSNVCLTMWLAAQARALIAANDLDAAAARIQEASAFISKSDERFYETVVRELEAELILARRGNAGTADAAHILGQALGLAHEQGVAGIAARIEARLASIRA